MKITRCAVKYARDLGRFVGAVCKHRMICRASSIVVGVHTRLTPRSATNDGLREILLEQMRSASRRLAFAKTYTRAELDRSVVNIKEW